MGGHGDAQARPHELAHGAEDPVLVRRVEVGVGLVEEEERRPLGEAPGDDDKPPLPPLKV